MQDRWRLVSVIVAVLLGLAAPLAAAERPNILWISCEDISPHLGSYGTKHAITPTLDSLADAGVRYTHAFTTCPVCATNRSSIITGMYPTSIGTHHMRCTAKLPEHIKCFPHYLREAGYHCTNNSKTDYNFPVPPGVWDQNNGKASWRGRLPDQPFFHVRNFTNTHESQNWPRGKQHKNRIPDLKPDQLQDPAKLELPPYYPDTPEVRRDWANYFENITQLDYNVARLLQQLEDDGLADDTIVFFWSDHGVGLPRGKRWLYDSGTRVPLIVHIPEKFRTGDQGKPGTVTDELISFIDLAPTVLNLCGVEIPKHMQGRAFLGQDLTPEREYVVSVRDRMDERYDMIRSIRTKKYRYTRNYMPWKPYAQWLNYGERNETMKALRQLHTEGKLNGVQSLFMADRKPVEELYDCEADPHELRNLALHPSEEHKKLLEEYGRTLDEWHEETRDLGLLPEAILDVEGKKHGNRWAIGQQTDRLERLASLRDFVREAVIDSHEMPVRLDDPDLVMRYWSVTAAYAIRSSHRSRPGEAKQVPDQNQESLRKVIRKGLNNDVAIVRLAAADGMCKMGEVEEGLPVLIKALKNPDPWVRLAAATALDELGEKAKPAIPELKKALAENRKKSKAFQYTARVVERALQKLTGKKPEDI